ncbi:MAG: hypothetical protein KKA67_16100 [Spirochaetes bacterium]|nr:hypothetical protein [Spirochaetota bacterium]MBU1080424.1 hypothetical protein [Spirochaetota bacterium]
MAAAEKGAWVEIQQTILEPSQRAPTLPEDTKATPLVMRVSGFLVEGGDLGAPATVETIIGRRLAGTLRTVNPSYSHSFGTTVPELLTIGAEAGL